MLHIVVTLRPLRILLTHLLWTPAQRSLSEVRVMFCECYFLIFYGRLMLRPRLTEVRETFTRGYGVLSVNREVTTWIFSWSSLNYTVGQKVMKFGIFSDPAGKLSALTPECCRIL